MPIKLINSGRGIEAWLERGPELSLIDSAANAGSGTEMDHDGEKLLLSKGPLSYEYKLFKIELHSAPAGARLGHTNWAPAEDDEPRDERDESDNSLGDNNGLNWARAPRTSPAPQATRAAAARSSEHLIDGRAFDAELQLHFHNRHLASSGHEALRLANEQPLASLFAVISVLISLKSAQKAEETAAAGPLDFVLNHLDRLQNQGDSLELRLSRAQLETLLTDRRQYVTYQGSMNRPPCAESVDWIILNRPLRVEANKFLPMFDKLATSQENVRPARQLNNRLLRTTINKLRYKRSPSSSASAGAQLEEKCRKVSELSRRRAVVTFVLPPASHLAPTRTARAPLGRDSKVNERQLERRPRRASAAKTIHHAVCIAAKRPLVRRRRRATMTRNVKRNAATLGRKIDLRPDLPAVRGADSLGAGIITQVCFRSVARALNEQLGCLCQLWVSRTSCASSAKF